MPLYDYGCAVHGTFEAYAGINDSHLPCPACREPARRRPFSGVPYLNGETVVSSIPDVAYREDAQMKQLHNTWGTAERSMEMIRSNIVEDKEGRRSVNTAAMSRS